MISHDYHIEANHTLTPLRDIFWQGKKKIQARHGESGKMQVISQGSCATWAHRSRLPFALYVNKINFDARVY